MRALITLMYLISTTALGEAERCSLSNKPPLQVRQVHPEFEPIVSKFESEFGVKVKFPVTFFIAEDRAVGTCSYWGDGSRLVRIDLRRWFTLSDTQKELVIYHELGHCSLNQPHDEEETEFQNVKGKWPKSIMRSFIFDPIEALVYKTNRNYYILELKYATRRLSDK